MLDVAMAFSFPLKRSNYIIPSAKQQGLRLASQPLSLAFRAGPSRPRCPSPYLASAGITTLRKSLSMPATGVMTSLPDSIVTADFSVDCGSFSAAGRASHPT